MRRLQRFVFGLFRLLDYRFSPRLADIGGTRFWRTDPNAMINIASMTLRIVANPQLRSQN